MRFPLLALLALLFTPPRTALSQLPVPVVSDTAQTAQIALLMIPDRLLRSRLGRTIHDVLSEERAKDPSSAAIERKCPGAFAAIEAVIFKATSSALQADIPDLRANIAGILTRQLQPEEQAQMLAFLETPTGYRLVDIGDQVLDSDSLAKSMGPDPASAHLSQKDIADALKPSFITKLSDENIRAMVAFVNTPAGHKLSVLSPMIQQTVAVWMNSFFTKRSQDLQTVVVIAARDYVAKACTAAH